MQRCDAIPMPYTRSARSGPCQRLAPILDVVSCLRFGHPSGRSPPLSSFSVETSAGSIPLTVGRRLAATGWMHLHAGCSRHRRAEGAVAILEVIAGISRSHGVVPVTKHAADADMLRAILVTIFTPCSHDSLIESDN